MCRLYDVLDLDHLISRLYNLLTIRTKGTLSWNIT